MFLMNTTLEVEQQFGRFSHLPADHVVGADLAPQLDQYVGGGWYVMIVTQGGQLMRWGKFDFGVMPDDPRLAAMKRTCLDLNGQAAYDGHWAVAFNRGEDEMVALWRDGDGDVHAIVDFTGRWWDPSVWPPAEVLRKAAEAVEYWRSETSNVLESRPSELYRKALGEKPPTGRR